MTATPVSTLRLAHRRRSIVARDRAQARRHRSARIDSRADDRAAIFAACIG
jgi:hypothetical protein